MAFKSTRLALALLGALTVATPLALTTSAEAAPRHDGGGMMGGGMGHMDAFHDRNPRPPMRAEHRPNQPRGHYHWRNGAWNWNHNQWVWAPGIWLRF